MKPIRTKFVSGSTKRIGYVGARYEDIVKVLGKPEKTKPGSDMHVMWVFKIADPDYKGNYRLYSIYDDDFGDDAPVETCTLWTVAGSRGKMGSKLASASMADIGELFPTAIVGHDSDFWNILEKTNRKYGVQASTMKHVKYSALARLQTAVNWDYMLDPPDEPIAWTEHYEKEIGSVEAVAVKVLKLLGYKETLRFTEQRDNSSRGVKQDETVTFKAKDLSLTGVRAPNVEELKSLFQKACGQKILPNSLLDSIDETDAEIAFEYEVDGGPLKGYVYFNYSHENGQMTEVWASYTVTLPYDDGY